VGLLAVLCFALTLVLILEAVPAAIGCWRRCGFGWRRSRWPEDPARRFLAGARRHPDLRGGRHFGPPVLTRLFVSDRSHDDGERSRSPRGWLEIDEVAGSLWLRLDEAVTHHASSADPRNTTLLGNRSRPSPEGDPRQAWSPAPPRADASRDARTAGTPEEPHREAHRLDRDPQEVLAACGRPPVRARGSAVGIVTRRVAGRGLRGLRRDRPRYYVLLASGEAARSTARSPASRCGSRICSFSSSHRGPRARSARPLCHPDSAVAGPATCRRRRRNGRRLGGATAPPPRSAGRCVRPRRPPRGSLRVRRFSASSPSPSSR